MPFWFRRPFLILRDFATSRERPDLGRLALIDDPEAFVWAILPHAARTFSACIALLPVRSALPAAVAYLYCRMLDTYEDLVPDRATREASLRAFAARLQTQGDRLAPAPSVEDGADRDERDRAHLLLVRRAGLVDRVFLSFDEPTRRVVRELVRDMAEGMRWSSATFEEQGGVLTGEQQLVEYCRHVLGNPAVFGARLLRLEYGAPPELSAEEREDAMRVGEMVQLANITRDVEKDLRRGIAYDVALQSDLCRTDFGDPQLAERCRAVRERLLRMAVARIPAYRRVLDAMRLPRFSVARASAVLMLLFTERYFRGCARRVGLAAWDGPEATLALFARTIRATVSRRVAHREIARIERAFLSTAQPL
jgi:phytoene/squalene synthetase